MSLSSSDAKDSTAEAVDDGGAVRLERLAAWDQLVQSKKKTANPTPSTSRRTHDADILPSQRALTLSLTPTLSPSSTSETGTVSTTSPSPSLSPAAAWEKLSLIRLKVPPTSSPLLLSQLQRCKVVSFDGLARHSEAVPSAGQDWVVFGVVSRVSSIRHTAKGEKFIMWTLTDLRGHLTTLFLFSAAFNSHWKEEPGTVIAAANASILPNNTHSASASSSSSSSSTTFVAASLSISSPSQLLLLGPALDFGYCASFKSAPPPSNSPYPTASSSTLQRCRNTIDLREGQYCEYHVASEYRKVAGARAGLNKTVSERSGIIHFGGGMTGGKKQGGRQGATGERTYSLPPTGVRKVPGPGESTPLKEKLLAALQSDAVKSGDKAPTTSHLTRPVPASKASHIARPFNPLSAEASAALQRPPLVQLAVLPASSSPSSGNPFGGLKRPRPLSAEETLRELRRAKALQQMQQHGPIAAPDPNTTSPITDRVLKAQNERESKRRKRGTDQPTVRLASDGAPIIQHDPSTPTLSTPAPPASPPHSSRRLQLEALFGPIDLDSVQGRSLLSASPAHVALMEAMKEEERREYMDFLAHKEELQRQMEGIREKKVQVWQCVTEGCGRRSEMFPATCKAKGHEMERRDGVKRWFECGACRARVSVVDRRLPRHCCHKCGKSEWKQSGMLSERSGMAKSERSQLQHKSEEQWSLRSMGGDGVMRNDAPSADGGGQED